MSLVQHVSALEGIDDQPTAEVFRPVRKVLSYDAFPPPPAEEQHHEPAYKVSTFKRTVQVTVTVLACWLASGLVFGYAALRPVLVSEGVYRELCTEKELLDNVAVCLEQDIKLNFFFTLASITTNVSALPVGAILDRYGPRTCNIIGSISLSIGCLLMAYAFSTPERNGYLIGNVFLALGGTFIFVPSYHIANAFPKHSGVIVALITGSFDASAAVFLFYRLVYEATNHRFGPDKFFICYTAIPALIFISQITLMPSQSYDTVSLLEQKIKKARDATRDVHSSDDEISNNAELRRVRLERSRRRRRKIQSIDDLLGDESERQQRAELEEERKELSVVWGVLHGLPAHKQMLSPWFVLITLLTVLQMLRMNYFIATIRAQYGYMLSSEAEAVGINDFFDVALPVGGVICTPFIGVFLDNLSVLFTLAVIIGLVTLIGILNSLPFVWAGYMTVCLFVLLRPLYYSAVSDYATKIFGFATFGRVYGTIICLSGIVNFSQTGIDALTLGPLKGDPIPVNIAFAVLGFVVGSMLLAFVWVQGRAVKIQKFGEYEDHERRRLISEEYETDSA